MSLEWAVYRMNSRKFQERCHPLVICFGEFNHAFGVPKIWETAIPPISYHTYCGRVHSCLNRWQLAQIIKVAACWQPSQMLELHPNAMSKKSCRKTKTAIALHHFQWKADLENDSFDCLLSSILFRNLTKVMYLIGHLEFCAVLSICPERTVIHYENNWIQLMEIYREHLGENNDNLKTWSILGSEVLHQLSENGEK